MKIDKKMCPVLNVEGFVEKGKQFDLDITLPEDERNVIYGIVKDSHGCPIEDAVVKLIEVFCNHGKEERRPVSHTFTDKDGQFVFGPLCADKFYDVDIWVNRVKHFKICSVCNHEGKCLEGVDMECCDMREAGEAKCEEKNEDSCEIPCNNKPCR